MDLLERARRWLDLLPTRTELARIDQPTRAKLRLLVHAGEALENPVASGEVFAYRIELGQVEERARTSKSLGLSQLRVESNAAEVERCFTPTTDDLVEYPSVVLASSDHVKVLLRANTYRLVGAVEREGAVLDRDHPLAASIGEVPSGRLAGYRTLSLSRGRWVTFVAELVPLDKDDARYGYRGVSDAPAEACALEARPLAEETDGERAPQPIEVREWLEFDPLRGFDM
ncbi:MAG: hypothetical protein U0271_09760 [Polyangiaceae bacterium]